MVFSSRVYTRARDSTGDSWQLTFIMEVAPGSMTDCTILLLLIMKMHMIFSILL